jgi:hypothetical protein
VLPNWVVQSLLPFFCLSAAYWNDRWEFGSRAIKYWLAPGLVIGLLFVIVTHDTRLVTRATHWQLPSAWDPTRRARGWMETTRVVEAACEKLSLEGKPVFLIGSHYEVTGELTFHSTAARSGLPDHPLVYFRTSKTPENQFFFWPGYTGRKGENALYVSELDFSDPKPQPPPTQITAGFTSVTDLGTFTIRDNSQPVRYLQIHECRDLR